MSIDWHAVQQELIPIKDYEDLIRRWRESFSYPFVCESFNYSMPQLADFAGLELGGDTRGRYTQYLSRLVGIFTRLRQSGVQDVLDLEARVETRQKLESFTGQSGIDAPDIAAVLKYLIYWFIPMAKPLGSLVRDDPESSQALQILRGLGIRTNLDLLQQGRSPSGRKELAQSSGLPEAVITGLVNRADFSRMPWASKATISNIIGAGYASLAQLANAGPEQLYADFYRYGESIGKNLKLGNEIENSQRIAKILPVVVR